MLARLHGLACADGDRSACRGRCEHAAGVYLDEVWDRCPVAEIDDDVELTAARSLRGMAKLSPLSGWPDSYTFGLVQVVSDLTSAEADRRASEEPSHG